MSRALHDSEQGHMRHMSYAVAYAAHMRHMPNAPIDAEPD